MESGKCMAQIVLWDMLGKTNGLEQYSAVDLDTLEIVVWYGNISIDWIIVTLDEKKVVNSDTRGILDFVHIG